MGSGQRPRLVFYEDGEKGYRWRFQSGNSRKTAQASESYRELRGAVNGFQTLHRALTGSDCDLDSMGLPDLGPDVIVELLDAEGRVRS